MRRCGLKLVPVNAPNVEYEASSIHIIDKWHLLSRLGLWPPRLPIDVWQRSKAGAVQSGLVKNSSPCSPIHAYSRDERQCSSSALHTL